MEKLVKKVKRENNHRKVAGYANQLVYRATKQELILKETLEELGIVFSFQKIYFNHDKCYILDFYLKTKIGRYAIEIDGKSHDRPKAKIYDQERTDWLLNKRNTNMLRFNNEEIDNDLNKVVAQIMMLQPKSIHEVADEKIARKERRLKLIGIREK